MGDRRGLWKEPERSTSCRPPVLGRSWSVDARSTAPARHVRSWRSTAGRPLHWRYAVGGEQLADLRAERCAGVQTEHAAGCKPAHRVLEKEVPFHRAPSAAVRVPAKRDVECDDRVELEAEVRQSLECLNRPANRKHAGRGKGLAPFVTGVVQDAHRVSELLAGVRKGALCATDLEDPLSPAPIQSERLHAPKAFIAGWHAVAAAPSGGYAPELLELLPERRADRVVRRRSGMSAVASPVEERRDSRPASGIEVSVDRLELLAFDRAVQPNAV